MSALGCIGCENPLTSPLSTCPQHGRAERQLKEAARLLEEAKKVVEGSECRDPVKLESMVRHAAQMLQHEGFAAIALCCSYHCGEHDQFHALMGLVTGETTATGNEDLRVMVVRLRALADQIERDFPLPPAEAPSA